MLGDGIRIMVNSSTDILKLVKYERLPHLWGKHWFFCGTEGVTFCDYNQKFQGASNYLPNPTIGVEQAY